jgi:hypothetical protein
MCEKCEDIDSRISRYRRLVAGGLDPLTIERISVLIQELQQRKEAMQH